MAQLVLDGTLRRITEVPALAISWPLALVAGMAPYALAFSGVEADELVRQSYAAHT